MNDKSEVTVFNVSTQSDYSSILVGENTAFEAK